MAECGDDLLVDLPFEGYDEPGQGLHGLEAPGLELGLVMPPARMRDVDLALLAREAECEPFLGLAAICLGPALAGDLRRNVIGVPFRRLFEQRHRGDVGLLVELPL